MKISDMKLLGPKLLVEVDPEPETFSGGVLVKPETVHEQAETEGTVLKVGTGHYINKAPGFVPIKDIEVGDKVCFIKFHKHTGSNPHLQMQLGDKYVLLDVKDVIYVRKNDD